MQGLLLPLALSSRSEGGKAGRVLRVSTAAAAMDADIVGECGETKTEAPEAASPDNSPKPCLLVSMITEI